MKETMLKKWKELLMMVAVVIPCLILGGMLATVVEIDVYSFDEFVEVFQRRFDPSWGQLAAIDDLVSMTLAQDMDDEEQSYLEWQFELKKQEVSGNEESLRQLAHSGYSVKLVDHLSNIPQEYRTSAIQLQIFRGVNYLVVDNEAQIIWCEYTAPTNTLTDAILALN